MAAASDNNPQQQNKIVGLVQHLFGRHAQNLPPDFTALYTDPVYHFSFRYPPALTVRPPNDGSTTIVIAYDAGRTTGFQVASMPVYANDPGITPARLARDLPNVVTRDHDPLKVRGARGGLLFAATEQKFGASFQAWFVRGTRLYQVTAMQEPLLRGILATWRFTK